MQIIKDLGELRKCVEACRAQEKTVGLVPTMGALHSGHLSLIRRAKSENNVCFVSIFVNPTQFNNKEDLRIYPRDLERDCELLSCEKVDFVFAPSVSEIYSNNELSGVFDFDFGGLDATMEGKQRPGHFNGVVQIVSRLFYLIRPRRAYFGEKDYQQLCIIRYMVYRSSMKGTFGELYIESCPIVRDNSGLALSSRNALLSDEERAKASNIYRILKESTAWVTELQAKRDKVKIVEEAVVRKINAIEGLKVDYFAIVECDSLQPVSSFSNAIGCIAVYCGSVRLIDNIKY